MSLSSFTATIVASLVTAYSSPSLFAAPTHEGGGGGRHFTGSRLDGLGCEVCHSGGEPLELEVLGLPKGGWSPGLTYTLDVAWSPTVDHAGVVLEFADEYGVAVGKMTLPPADELTNAERCDSGTRAAKALTLDDGRSLVTIGDCGAHRVRLQWQAPDQPTTAWLHLATVRGDGSGDATGDGARVERFELDALGLGEDSSGCRLASTTPPAGWMVLIALAWIRRRRHVGLALGLVALGGCVRVQPWERGRLAQPDMQLQLDPDLIAGSEHAVEYREGSAGATGSGGGGCGCN